MSISLEDTLLLIDAHQTQRDSDRQLLPVFQPSRGSVCTARIDQLEIYSFRSRFTTLDQTRKPLILIDSIVRANRHRLRRLVLVFIIVLIKPDRSGQR